MEKQAYNHKDHPVVLLCQSYAIDVSFCPVQVFIYRVVSSCFYFEVWCHPCVPVKLPAYVNLFHLCLVVFSPSCLFKPRPPSCLGQITCRFYQYSSRLFFPEWFPLCYLFYSWDTGELPARLLYLCCVSWFPGFDFCFIEQLWSSLTHQFCLCVHSLVHNWSSHTLWHASLAHKGN